VRGCRPDNTYIHHVDSAGYADTFGNGKCSTSPSPSLPLIPGVCQMTSFHISGQRTHNHIYECTPNCTHRPTTNCTSKHTHRPTPRRTPSCTHDIACYHQVHLEESKEEVHLQRYLRLQVHLQVFLRHTSGNHIACLKCSVSTKRFRRTCRSHDGSTRIISSQLSVVPHRSCHA